MTLLDQVIKQHVTAEMIQRSVADLRIICELAQRVQDIEGDIAELGVYRGGSAKLLQSLFPDRRIWLFDTFAGNPTPGPRDENIQGSFAADESEVRKYLKSLNTTIYTGLFRNTADLAADRRFAFVHLDCDQEQSVTDGCVFFWPRLNGIILCDDYGNGSCGGAKHAFDTYFLGVATIYRLGERAFVWQYRDLMW